MFLASCRTAFGEPKSLALAIKTEAWGGDPYVELRITRRAQCVIATNFKSTPSVAVVVHDDSGDTLRFS